MYAWWTRFGAGKRLRLIEARDSSDRLVGLAPLCLEREGTVLAARTLRFLGTESVSSEYLDVLVDADLEESTSAALLEAVLAGRDWDVLSLTDLREDAVALLQWEPRLRALGYDIHRDGCEICPYLPLPESVDEHRRQLGASMRYALRRATRKLEEHGYAYRAVAEARELPSALERLFDLHASRWAARQRSGNFGDPRVQGFHKDLATLLGERGSLRIGQLVGQGRVIAAIYTLEHDCVVSFYQSGFEPGVPQAGWSAADYSPGFVLIGKTIEDAIRRRFVEFDFLRGEEAYKSRWTSLRRRTWTLAAIRSAAYRARARHRLRRWIRVSRSRVRRILEGARRHDGARRS